MRDDKDISSRELIDGETVDAIPELKKAGRPRQNFWLALPINYARTPPYDAVFKRDPTHVREWLYLQCLQQAAFKGEIGILSCNGVPLISVQEVAEIFDVEISHVNGLFEALKRWRLMELRELNGETCFFFRDAVAWTENHKSTNRVASSRARKVR